MDSCGTEALNSSQTSSFSESEWSPHCSIFTQTLPNSRDFAAIVATVGSFPRFQQRVQMDIQLNMSASLNRTLSGARSSNLAPQAECLSFLWRRRFQTFSILLTGLNPQLSLHFLLNRRHGEVVRWNFLQLPACLVPTLSLSFLFWWKRCPRLLRLKLCPRPAPSGLLRDYTLVSILSAGFFPLVFTHTLISPI